MLVCYVEQLLVRLVVGCMTALLTSPLCNYADVDQTPGVILAQRAPESRSIDVEHASSPGQQNPEAETLPWKIVVSGFYSLENERFIVPNICMAKTDQTTPSFETEDPEIPVVVFQLTDLETGQTVQQINQPYVKAEFEVFYEDRHPERLPAPTLFIVIFDLPQDREHWDFSVHVISEKGNVVFTAPASVKQNPEVQGLNLLGPHGVVQSEC